MSVAAKGNELRGARGALIGLAVLAIGVVAAAWFLHDFHRVEREFPTPARGEAAYNPLYALQKSLEADGVRVDARQRLDLAAHPPGPRDTLLLFGDPRTLAAPEAQRLLDWVEGGGHLIVRTPEQRGWDGKAPTPLFAALRLALRDGDGGAPCARMRLENGAVQSEFCGARRFVFSGAAPELAWGDLKDGYVYARLARGGGRVDVLADMDFLSNGRGAGVGFGDLFGGGTYGRGLRDEAHRALARQVLAPNYGRGTVHLVYSAQMPSFWRMLLQRGWPAWLPLALALSAWLWRRARRFGPLRPAPAPARRSLLEHVRASGEHLFRYRRGVLLYAAVRQAFLARLRRRDPYAAALAGEPQIAALSERFRLPAETLRKALQAPGSHDRAGFRDRISTLIELRNRL